MHANCVLSECQRQNACDVGRLRSTFSIPEVRKSLLSNGYAPTYLIEQWSKRQTLLGGKRLVEQRVGDVRTDAV